MFLFAHESQSDGRDARERTLRQFAEDGRSTQTGGVRARVEIDVASGADREAGREIVKFLSNIALLGGAGVQIVLFWRYHSVTA
jgi:hypothetical protein